MKAWAGAALYTLLVGCFTGCAGPVGANPTGGSPVTQPATPAVIYPTTLNGSWHLFGYDGQNRLANNAVTPAMTVSLGSLGTTLMGRAQLEVGCTTGTDTIVSYSFPVAGTVSAMGDVDLNGEGSTARVHVKATAPTTSQGPWSGTYDIEFVQTSCTFRGSGAFSATILPTVTGTYRGTLENYRTTGGQTAPPNVAVTMTLAQTVNTTVLRAGDPIIPYPVITGTATVQGTNCSITGTTLTEMGGDFSEFSFKTAAGNYFSALAFFRADGSPQVDTTLIADVPGCAAAFYGPLTRQ